MVGPKEPHFVFESGHFNLSSTHMVRITDKVSELYDGAPNLMNPNSMFMPRTCIICTTVKTARELLYNLPLPHNAPPSRVMQAPLT